MKIYFLLSQKFCQLLEILSSCTFSSARKWNVVHVRHTFVCWAVDTFCVEQLTFLKKVSSSQDLSRCILSSWPWLVVNALLNHIINKISFSIPLGFDESESIIHPSLINNANVNLIWIQYKGLSAANVKEKLLLENV